MLSLSSPSFSCELISSFLSLLVSAFCSFCHDSILSSSAVGKLSAVFRCVNRVRSAWISVSFSFAEKEKKRFCVNSNFEYRHFVKFLLSNRPERRGGEKHWRLPFLIELSHLGWGRGRGANVSKITVNVCGFGRLRTAVTCFHGGRILTGKTDVVKFKERIQATTTVKALLIKIMELAAKLEAAW